MGLCKTSNFSVFTFINASNLEFCTFLQQLCILHDEVQRFEWKSLQNDDITLRYSIAQMLSSFTFDLIATDHMNKNKKMNGNLVLFGKKVQFYVSSQKCLKLLSTIILQCWWMSLLNIKPTNEYVVWVFLLCLSSSLFVDSVSSVSSW